MEDWEKELPAGVTADNVKALRAAGWRCTPPGGGGMKMPKSPMMALFEDADDDNTDDGTGYGN